MDSLLEIVDNLSLEIPNRNYWYLRTEGGEHYEEFRDNNYIAINYNYVQASAIQSNNDEHLKTLITTNESKFEGVKYENLERGKKSSVTKIVGTLKNFNGMSKGDIVIIPSSDSDRFSIGEIGDNSLYRPSEEELQKCDFILRRKVKWRKIDTYIPSYSPILYSLKHTHGALSKIEKHSEYINSILNPLFVQDNKYYFTLDVKKDEDIPLVYLKKLLDSYYNILVILNKGYGFNEDLDRATIKLNLNSKGKVNLIQDKLVNSSRNATVAAAVLIAMMSSCNIQELEAHTELSHPEAVEIRAELDVLNEAKHGLEITDDNFSDI